MGEVSRLFNAGYLIKIYLLGEFRITSMGGEDITPTAAKARCILAILVLSKNGEIARDKLTQLLWSRHAQEQARTSLRQSLSLLRRTFRFEAEEFFTADRNKVYLKRDKVWLDSHEIINNSSELLKNGVLSNICRGPALENLDANDPEFKSWLLIEKQALEKNIKTALECLLTKEINNEDDRTQRKSIVESLLKIDASNNRFSPVNSALNTKPADYKNTKVNSEKKPQPEIPREKTSVATDNLEEIYLARDLLLYRNALLKKVINFWIDGVLGQSLFKKVMIELQLEEKLEQQIVQTWQGIVQYPMDSFITDSNAGSNMLRSNAEIGTIFSEFSESMLILGAPGSGKTTLLLGLTQQLLERAEKDSSYPVPVVFHLSTWAKHRSSLSTWLEDELENRYQMPRKLGIELIKNRGILPLLDGLDEVDVRCRADCVDAINYCRQQNTWLSMAICSREEDYKKLSRPVAVTGTILIQAITENQCDAYLQAAGESLKGLSAVLAQNDQLKELLTTPLMLNIASIVYRDQGDNILPTDQSPGNVKDHLFSTYTQTMLTRRISTNGSSTHYNKENTCRWLTWLAHSLHEEKQSIFYLDSMQPCRVSKPSHYWVITQGSVMVCALITGLTLGLVGGFVTDLKYSLSVSLVLGAIGGYAAGLMGYGDKIRPLIRIKLSWVALRRVSVVKQVGNLALASCFGLGVILVYDPIMGLVLGILFFLFFLLINSLDLESEYKHKVQQANPNEGIRQSLRNTVIALAVGGGLGLIIGFLTSGWEGAIIAGVLTALLTALFFGGHTCIQHYLLRYYLWRNKSAPLNYVRFLEFAVDRIFLYRVGGGYIFIHRSLAEYFAKKL